MTRRLLAPLPSIEVVHFDDDPAEMTAALEPIESTLAQYGTALVFTSIATDPPDWDGFVDAVTCSSAQIVVPTLHGFDDGTMGPVDHDWGQVDESAPLADRDWRWIEEAFPTDSISAPTLLLFSCEQWANHEAWRRAAPSSRLVLREGTARRITALLWNLLGPRQGELTPSLSRWHVIDP